MPIPDSPMPEELERVSPSAGLSEVATPDAFGAGVGSATAQQGEALTRLYHDANAAAVMRAHNDVDAAANDQLYNRKTGLLFQNLGENAPPAVDKAQSAYTANASSAKASLTNDAQREMFDKAMGEHGMVYRRTLAEYEHKQVTAGQNANTQAYITNRQTDIAQNYDKPDIVNASIAQQRAALIQAYARNTSRDPVALQEAVDKGQAPEDLKSILANNTSASHMVALNTMMANGQNQTARAYFDATKEQLNAQDLDRATRMVKVGSQEDEARNVANDIIAKQHVDSVPLVGPEDKSKISLEDALARLEARRVTDTSVHDAAESRIIHHFKLMADAHKEQQGALLEQATQAVDNPDNIYRDIPANVLGQLDTREREAVVTYRDKMLRQGRVQTNEDVRLRLRTAAADSDQWDAFLAEKPEIYKGSLNTLDYREYENARAHVQGQVSRRDDQLSQGMVSTQVAKQLFNENGLEIPAKAKPGTAAYEAAAARQNRFMDQLHRAVAADALTKKKNLSEEEIRAHASKLFATQTWQTPLKFYDFVGVGSGKSLFGTDRASGPAFEAPFADKIAYRREDIPAAELKKLLASGEAGGFKRTDKELVDDYNATLVKQSSATP